MNRAVLLLYSLNGVDWHNFTFSSTLRVPSVRIVSVNTYILTSALLLSGTSFLGASV